MRRPTPLPPPPPRAASEPAADEDFWTAPATDAGTAPPDDTAPITPIETDDVDAPDSARMRTRDVWAAARARRRALRAEVRRFTARQRHRRVVWLGAAAAILLLVLGTLGAAYSPLFAVERVRVVGTAGLDAAQVEEALAGQIGTPLSLVDSSEVKAALVAFPLVESYTLEARPPHELVVRIVERTPIGSLKSAAGYTLVDAAGVALATTPQRPEGHPSITVTGGATSAAFDAVGTVFRSLPEGIRAQVTAMEASTANDVALTLGELDVTVVWGDAEDSAYKAVVLEKIMQAEPPSGVSVYDVSSPNAVVVR